MQEGGKRRVMQGKGKERKGRVWLVHEGGRSGLAGRKV